MNNLLTKKLYLQSLLAVILLFLGGGALYAQTGPGGVKKADGTTSLRLWLKGEYFNPGTDNAAITQWNDKSGYGRNFLPNGSTASFNQVSGPFGGRTVAQIESGNLGAYLSNANAGGDLNNTTDWTVYVVTGIGGLEPQNNENTLISWGDFATATPYNFRSLNFTTTPNYYGTFRNGTEVVTSSQSILGNTAATAKITSAYQSGNSVNWRVNGVSVGTQTMTMPNFTNTSMYLGAYYDQDAAFTTGNFLGLKHQIAEVIAFNGALTDLERIIVDNYLGAKYNIAVAGGNDYYTGHSTGATGHVLDLIAIGRTASAKQSIATTDANDDKGDKGAFTLEEYNNTLDIGEFVMAAHNNDPLVTDNNVTELPVLVGYERWKRSYYVDKTGSVDVKMTFDLGKAGAFTAAGSYILIYRATNSGAFSKVSTTTPTIVGSGATAKVTFIVPNSVFQDGYYTIASTSGTNKPIILYSRIDGGDWSSPDTWTLEPDGVTINNPSNYVPDINKGVVVLSGKRVEMSADFQSAMFVTVDGTLDIVNTNNHTFTQISGLGTIKLATPTFPAHTTSVDFTSAGRGTVEYYGLLGGTLSGLTTYNNIIFGIEDPTKTWTLGTNVTVNGNVQIKSGATLNGGTRTITLLGNWTNNGTFTANSANIVFSGTTQQFINGNHTVFGTLTVNKGLYRNVTLNADMTAKGGVTLTLGNIVLGKYNLTIDEATTVTGSSTAMIEQWGKEIVGQGKVYVRGTSAAHFQHNFPIGNANVFANMNVSTFSVTGSPAFITVETTPYETTQPNGLKRKWKIGTSGISGVTDFRATFNYPSTEYIGTPTALINDDNGVPTFLPNGGGSAITSTNTAINAANTKLQGEWTLGVVVPVLYSRTSGDWGTASTWSSSCGGAAGSDIPNENTYVVICGGNTVTINANTQKAAAVSFAGAGGTLNLGTTTGHFFADIKGTNGTIRLQSGDFPTHVDMREFAENLTNTVIYEGAGNYSMTNLVYPNAYPNLTIQGGGTKTMPSDHITVKGQLTIVAGTTFNANNRNILIEGNWLNNGTFVANGTDQMVVFKGSATQTVSGTTFNRLEVTKPIGTSVNLTADVTVDGVIILSTGNIVLNNNNLILTQNSYFSHAFGQLFSSAGMVVSPYPTVAKGKIEIQRASAAGYNNLYIPIGSPDDLAGNPLRYAPVEIIGFTAAGAGSIAVHTYPHEFATVNYVDRKWELNVTGFTGVVDAKVRFSFDPTELQLAPGDYMGAYQAPELSGGVTFTSVNNSFYDDKAQAFGVTLTGNDKLHGTWYLGPRSFAGNIYYSYQSLEWKNPNTWTLDATGGTLTGSPVPDGPKPNDRLVILPGRTVSMAGVNSTEIFSTEIRAGGYLDLGTTTGHKLGIVTGDGTIVTSNTLPPQGNGTDYYAFVQPTGGTVEFRNAANFTIPTIQIGSLNTYNNIKFNMTAKTIAGIQKNDMFLNGFLSVQQGTYQINDATNAVTYSTWVSKDFVVGGANSQVRVGTGNANVTNNISGNCNYIATTDDQIKADPNQLFMRHLDYFRENYHRVVMFGNFLNYGGDVRFTNAVQPVYNGNTTTGAAHVFMFGYSDTQNAFMSCHGISYFNTLVIDKGSNRDKIVTLDASQEGYFSLFGSLNGKLAANCSKDAYSPATPKALVIRTGTLRLTGYVHIPTLTEPASAGQAGPKSSDNTTDFYIPANGGLWLDGANVKVRVTADCQADALIANPALQGILTGGSPWQLDKDNAAMVVYGLLKVSNGKLYTGYSGGIQFRVGVAPEMKVEGGEIYAPQIRVFQDEGSIPGKATYIQSGGSVFLYPSDHGEVKKSQGLFSLPQPTNVFQMSGGLMKIFGSQTATNNATNGECFEVRSAEGNYNVTGGTVELHLTAPVLNADKTAGCVPKPTGTQLFYKLVTTSPLYNLTVSKSGGSLKVGSGGGAPSLDARVVEYIPLTILNTLTVTSEGAGVTGTPAIFNANASLPGQGNTNINYASDVIIGGNMNLLGGQYIPGTDKTTRFDGFTSATQTITNNIVNGFDIQATFENFEVNNFNTASTKGVVLAGSTTQSFLVNDDLRLLVGTADDGGEIFEIKKNITNNTSHISTGSGKMLLSGTTVQNIGGDNTGEFGNVEVTNANGANGSQSVLFAADQIVNGTLTLTSNRVFDINRYALNFSTTGSVTGTYSSTRMIATRGRASDKGVSKFFTNTTPANPYLFPVGAPYKTSGYQYTPYELTIVSAATYGTVRVSPVASTHPLVTRDSTVSPAKAYALDYYWAVRQSGFTTPVVKHKFTGTSTIAAPTANNAAGGCNTPSDFYIPGYVDLAQSGTNLKWITAPETKADDVLDLTNKIFKFDGAGAAGAGISNLQGDYTMGQNCATNRPANSFGAFRVFYSMATQKWRQKTTWSETSHTGPVRADGRIPDRWSVVFVGGGHTVHANNETLESNSVVVREGSVLDLETVNNHKLGVYFDDGEPHGKIRISSNAATAPYPDYEVTEVLNEDGGTIEYYTTGTQDFTIPYIATDGKMIPSYYNLILNPGAGRTITMPNQNLTIYKDLSVTGAGTAQLSAAAGGNLDVRGNVFVTSGTLRYMNGTARSVTVKKDVFVQSGGIFDVANSAAVANSLTMDGGSIYSNGTFDMRNNVGTAYALVTFTSSTHAFISGTGSADFERLIIDKGQDSTYRVEANVTTFSITGSTPNPKTVLEQNNLQITNGTFKLNSNATITLLDGAYTAGNRKGLTATDVLQPYTIPSSGMLWIDKGTVQITRTGNMSALYLNGKLKVTGTGAFINESNVASDNFIEIKSTPECMIDIQGSGTIRVGGQIRRSVNSTSGGLSYLQSGGETIVGTINALETDRGMFEVLGEGSRFEMRGGKLTIARTVPSGVTSDLYLYPQNSFVTGGTVQVGSATASHTPVGQIVKLDSKIPLWNVRVNNVNAPTALLRINNLHVLNDLEVATTGTMNGNNLDVFVGGDLINDGTYSNVDTTTMNSTFRNQQIRGTNVPNFNHLVIDNTALINTEGKGIVTVASVGTVNVNKTLTMKAGIFDDTNNIINVDGDVYNSSIHRSSAGGKILLDAPVTQIIGGAGGQFGNIELNKASLANLADVQAVHTINGNLNLIKGYFHIGNYLLNFGTAATITGTFAVNNAMIRTFGAPGNGGVRKFYAPGTFDFTVPVGVYSVINKYTPATYKNTNAACTGGSITVRPINLPHPNTTSESNTELRFYWQVFEDGFISARPLATHTYKFEEVDVRGDKNKYIAAGWINNTWHSNTDRLGSVDKIGNIIKIDGGTLRSNLGMSHFYGDYTAGYEDEFLAIDTFRSIVTTGDWNVPTVWDKQTAPTYKSVVIVNPGHTINAQLNSYVNTAVVINGILNLGNTQSHQFGEISGTGTLAVSRPSLPLGDYTKFVAPNTGTIEYSGAEGFPLTRIDTYNNMVVSNTSIITMAETDLTIYGNLTVNNGSNLVNKFGKDVSISGNLTNNGIFDTGDRGSTIKFNGSGTQVIGGTSQTDFRRLAVVKPTDVLQVQNNANIAEYLTLTQGIVQVNLTRKITMGVDARSDEGNYASYVQGYMCKLGTANFVFPIGNTYWARLKIENLTNADNATMFCADYYPANHSSTNVKTNMNYPSAGRVVAPLTSVSTREYWHIDRFADAGNDATAKVSLYYEDRSRSYLLDPIVMAHYHWTGNVWNNNNPFTTALMNYWYKEAATFTTVTNFTTVGGILSSNANLTQFSPVTDGSENTQLPVYLLSFSAKSLADAVEVFWRTVSETNNHYFTVQRSADGVNFEDIAVVQGAGNSNRAIDYRVLDEKPLAGTSYYRLKDTDYDGNENYSRIVSVNRANVRQTALAVFPNPSQSGQGLAMRLSNFVDQEIVLTITDAMGRQVSRRIMQVGGNSIEQLVEFDQKLSAGIYVIKMVAQEGVFTEKVLITR